ncbi:peptide ABC transporter substrate-binding protein [Agrilactobacillus fermenti]|uniref:peptide ABC transporter substrate-binding protein n=1 Tax=Agrilactobacillus fermenti TaxID=2586909 RepID=UPI003A5C48F4
MKHLTTKYFVILVIILSALIGSPNLAMAENEKTLNVTVTTPAATADPSNFSDAASADIMTQTMTGLYQLDNHGKVIPGIATKIVSPTNNGKVYTFELRHSKWSNGEPVVADDFVYALRRMADPQTKSQIAQMLINIQNFKAAMTGKAKPDTIGVKALSKYKLQITLAKPTPYLNTLLALVVYPLNQKAVTKYGSKYGTNGQSILTNGAYKLANWNSTAEKWDYIKNNNYFDAKDVHIQKVHTQVIKDSNTGYNLFSDGKVQETSLSGTMARQNEHDPELTYQKSAQLYYLAYNAQKKATGNLDFRRAVAYAINRKALTNNVLQDGSIPAYNMIPTGLATNSKNQDFSKASGKDVTYDKHKAQQYWQAAQKKLGKKVSVSLLTSDEDSAKKIADYLQGQLQQTLKGLSVHIVTNPAQQKLQQQVKGNFEMTVQGFGSGVNDPIDYLNFSSAGNSFNFGRYHNQAYEAVMTKVNSNEDANNADKRWQDMLRASKLQMTQQPVTPLYQKRTPRLINKQVKNLNYLMLIDAQYRYATYK